MDQLEAFYDTTPKAPGFIERKIDIPAYTVNLYGPPQSGKTWLVLDYLSRIPKKKHLYIDFRDLRIDKDGLNETLQRFVEREKIDTVVLDHYDGSVAVPRVRQCILVTAAPDRSNPFIPLLHCPTLDFEEFLAFEKRLVSLEHSFSLYLRYGSLPAMSAIHETRLTPEMHRLIRQIFPDPSDMALFRHIGRHQGKAVSAHQIYTALKRSIRISKDRLYRTLHDWEEEKTIFWIPRLDHPRAAKKLLFFDFALPASLYFEKSLMGQLQTVAARKLLQKHPDVAYTDRFDFFDPQSRRAWLISPFAGAENIARKAATLIEEIERYRIESVTILTVSNAFEFMIEGVPLLAQPLYEWALSD